jgi:hypothetical protein
MDRDDEETTFDMEGHLALVPNTSYPMMVLGRQGGRGTGLSEHWQCLRLLGWCSTGGGQRRSLSCRVRRLEAAIHLSLAANPFLSAKYNSIGF